MDLRKQFKISSQLDENTRDNELYFSDQQPLSHAQSAAASKRLDLPTSPTRPRVLAKRTGNLGFIGTNKKLQKQEGRVIFSSIPEVLDSPGGTQNPEA